MICPTGLYGFETRRKALRAATKRRLETQGVDRMVVAMEPCAMCGHWHMERAK